MTTPKWLVWAQNLQAIAQSGLAYTQNPFERERYLEVSEIAVEILADQAGLEAPILRELFAAEAGYATPKLDVRGVVFRDGKILLVRELSDGGWTLPGGWVDVNNTPSGAVEREVWEETGYRVKAKKLLALYDRNQHGHTPYIFHLFKMYFLCDLIGGEPADSVETSGAAFFDESHIPPLSLARTTPEVLARLFEHHRHPEWQTDFD